MSDLAELSPLRLVSAACLNSDLSKFDNYVYYTSLLFVGVCALVWIVYYARVHALRKAEKRAQAGAPAGAEAGAQAQARGQPNEEGGEAAEDPANESTVEAPLKTADDLYSEHMQVFLLITFLAYPNLSKIQFESLDCGTVFEDKKFLR